LLIDKELLQVKKEICFTSLRGVRHFHSFAFEIKRSTLRNKNASSTSSKMLCEPDWTNVEPFHEGFEEDVDLAAWSLSLSVYA
jgi:hypothetical protein